MAMRLSGLMSGMDTESIISQLVEAKKAKVTKAVKAQKSLKYKQDAWKTLNNQILKLYHNALGNLRFEGSFTKKTTKVSNSNIVSVITGDGAMNGVQSLKVKELAKSGYLTGGKLELQGNTDPKAQVTGDTKMSELGFTGKGTINLTLGDGSDGVTPIIVDENTTVSSFVSGLRSAGLNANFDEASGRIFVTSKGSGTENDFKLSVGDEQGVKLLNSLGLNNEETMKDYYAAKWNNGSITAADKKALADEMKANFKFKDTFTFDESTDINEILKNVEGFNSTGNFATNAGKKTEATDAKIYLNGVEYTSSSNSFNVNGLTLTVNATTADNEEVTITTQDDTEGVYDMVKGFLKEYNALINQMDKLYNADSAKGYEPLTDEEKDAMSDSAIEEWENKIKDSILRKDSSLSLISSEMKRIMMEGVNVQIGTADNGDPVYKKMYLSNFGINTLGYFNAAENEKNAYHIDGDSDDTETAGNPDKLKTMIANDPDMVVGFFTGLAKNLYSRMTELMGTTDYSSLYHAYDDKKMQKEYDEYTVKIKDLENKLADYEDKWYAKFAAMETALAKMQKNASAVTSLLGG